MMVNELQKGAYLRSAQCARSDLGRELQVLCQDFATRESVAVSGHKRALDVILAGSANAQDKNTVVDERLQRCISGRNWSRQEAFPHVEDQRPCIQSCLRRLANHQHPSTLDHSRDMSLKSPGES